MTEEYTDPVGVAAESVNKATQGLADFLIEVVKNREKVSGEILASIAACETMMTGLPKIVEAMSVDEEGLRLNLGSDIRQMRADGAPEEFLKWAKEHGDLFIAKLLTFTKSVRAVAKTQVTLARHLRNTSMLMLIYSGSDSCGTDAAKLASKLGRGDEALKALWKSKFGETFGGR